MCVCNCAANDLASQVSQTECSKATERPVNHQLFNWITILLLTGWMLVVGIAANTAEVDKSAEAPTVQAFIRGLL